MPQGAFKKKSGASGVGKKQKATQKKKAQLKKGGQYHHTIIGIIGIIIVISPYLI